MREELNEFFSFVEPNRIYLPASMCDLLENHLREIRKVVHLAGSYGGTPNFIPRIAEQRYDAFTKAYEIFNNDIPKARGVLETEFRNMLGVN